MAKPVTPPAQRMRPHLWLIALIGVLVPQRLRADWRQEWEAELRYREQLLAEWDKLNWQTKLDLWRRSAGAFIDALQLQPQRWEDEMFQDIRYGVRMLLKQPGFALVAVLSLALGIGANTAIFSLVDALLLRSLPVQAPERLVLFGKAESIGITNSFPSRSWDLFSYPFYQALRQRNQVFAEVAALQSFPEGLHGLVNTGGAAGEQELMVTQLVSGSYFSTLGVNAMLGRTLTAADDQVAGGHPVVVLSHKWWEKRFGSDPGVIGKTITIGQTVYTIIGVTPKEFFGTTVGQAPSLWVPLAMEEKLPQGRQGRNAQLVQSLYLIARLKDGVTREQAGTEVNLLFKQILHEFAGAQPSAERLKSIQGARIELTPAGSGLSELRRQFSLPLRILLAVVGVVLLIACANVANLLLARATGRASEFALRLALGANRTRLVRQLLTESVLLAVCGGVLGILLAWWGSRVLVQMVNSGPEPLALDVSPDLRVLGFTLLVSLFSAIVFGTAPALRAARIELNASLKAGKGAVAATSRSLFGKALVIAQVALSLVLLVGAGLFVRTLINLQSVPTGFQPQSVFVFQIDTSATGYKEDAQLANVQRQVEERVKAVPGVRAASFSMFLFNQGGWTTRAFTQGSNPAESQERRLANNVVGLDFFTAMGLPLLQGRGFGPQDTEQAPKVAVISETMAQQFFPGQSPLGQHFWLGRAEDREDIEVIGVVRDAKYQSLDENPMAMAYYPHAQRFTYLNNFEVSLSGAPGTVIPAVRQAIKEVNRNLPIDEVATMSEHLDRSLVQQRLIARLSAFFGLTALLLACIGLYGILSYAVARRTHEIGIRLALGAQRGKVVWLVLREALALVTSGIAVGLLAALFVTKLADSLLFGLKPTDPLTLLIATVLLMVVATLAGYLPARRAAHVDPLVALRDE
jgi:predicted permease